MATATTTTTQPEVITVEGDQCVELRDIDWKGYSRILQLRGERPAPKIIYLDGSLLLVSPSPIHEIRKKRLGDFVSVVLEELDIDYIPTGGTTFRRRRKKAGVEPDESFYLTNLERIAERIESKKAMNMKTDPPPDLAVEAVHTHDARAALEVYRRLRVPEAWICDSESLRIFVRQANGRYTTSESSAAFPFLKASEIFDWVTRPVRSQAAWLKELRRWVREVLAPRRAGPQAQA
jgi:Uma2 family endonuclease